MLFNLEAQNTHSAPQHRILRFVALIFQKANHTVQEAGAIAAAMVVAPADANCGGSRERRVPRAADRRQGRQQCNNNHVDLLDHPLYQALYLSQVHRRARSRDAVCED